MAIEEYTDYFLFFYQCQVLLQALELPLSICFFHLFCHFQASIGNTQRSFAPKHVLLAISPFLPIHSESLS
jgi:hypothetical protein